MQKEKKFTQYQRIGILTIDEVMPYILENQYKGSKNTHRVQIKDFLVKVTSLRLKTFAKTGTSCSCCGIEAEYFAVEKNNKDQHYHLNLWGKDKENKPILFTHDHILARSLGGADNLTNTETMCSPCNFEKSLIEMKIKQTPEKRDELLQEIEFWKLNKKPILSSSKKMKF